MRLEDRKPRARPSRAATAAIVFLAACVLAACLTAWRMHEEVQRGRKALAELQAAAAAAATPGVMFFQEPDRLAHAASRKVFVFLQAGQAPVGSTLLLGDSITEALLVERMAGAYAFNAGVGGSDTAWHLANTLPLFSIVQPRRALIALGVNDAQTARNPGSPERLREFRANYQRIVDAAREAGARPALSLILPVEAGKPLGAGYFDMNAINAQNQIIRDVAGRSGATLCDCIPVIAGPDRMAAPGATVDGVHPTPQASLALRQCLERCLDDNRADDPASSTK